MSMNCPPSCEIKRLDVKMLMVHFIGLVNTLSLYIILQKYKSLKLTLTICLGKITR